jgi:hypothetical protein
VLQHVEWMGSGNHFIQLGQGHWNSFAGRDAKRSTCASN